MSKPKIKVFADGADRQAMLSLYESGAVDGFHDAMAAGMSCNY
jgi:hypothetical protein